MSSHKTAPSVNAFPRMFGNDAPQDGLSKREYFAAVAMQGVLSHLTTRVNTEEVARAAVAMADQLIIELNKTN
jgi:hypothetical protein